MLDSPTLHNTENIAGVHQINGHIKKVKNDALFWRSSKCVTDKLP